MMTNNNHELKNNGMRIRWMTAIGLVLILLLGAFLRFYQLGASGYGNEYYAATVKSMLTSWHNFFFVSYEPGGSVSVDKPPLGFWFEAASAAVFGLNGFALALPNVLAGLGSILLLFYLVKKPFGNIAGLLAALALALTPITVITERNNTIDGMLVFMLLLSVWAFFKAVEKQKVSFLYLGVILLGLGFNIKMLQAFMILPALYLLYFFGIRQKWWRRLLHLGTATLVLAAVSLSWALIVDAVPASQRPFVGSSTNNTVLELIVGHNGIERFTKGGISRDGANDSGNTTPMRDGGGDQNGQPGNLNGQPGTQPGIEGQTPPQRPDGLPEGFGGQPAPQDDFNNMPGIQRFAGRGAPGMGQDQNTSPGLLRLFTRQLDTQASWLLPLALLAALLFFLLQKRLAATTMQWLSVAFWSAWLIPVMGYFSFTSGIWHTYYLIMLGPAMAALTGVAYWLVTQTLHPSPLLSKILLTVFTLAAVGYGEYLLLSAGDALHLFAILLAVAALIALAAYWLRPVTWIRLLVCLTWVVASFTWALLSVLNPSSDTNLPSAQPSFGATWNLLVNTQATSSYEENLKEYLLANTEEGSYLVAVMSSRQASYFILNTSRPVLTLGGFTGSDTVVTAAQLSEMVRSGALRYVLDSGDLQSKREIYAWVSENCSAVSLPFQLSGFGSSGPGNAFSSGQGAVLYDCK